MRKMRFGILVGFCAGYYFGSRAGKERHEQINRMLRKVRRSDAVDAAAGKAKAVVDLSVERARDFVEHRGGATHEGPSGPVAVKGTEPVSYN